MNFSVEKTLPVNRRIQVLLTCSHRAESFDFVFSDPLSVRVVCRHLSKRLFNHIGVHHQADIFGDLRHEVCQVRPLLGTPGQYQTVRTEIFHVIAYSIEAASVAQGLDEGVCLSRGSPVNLY